MVYMSKENDAMDVYLRSSNYGDCLACHENFFSFVTKTNAYCGNFVKLNDQK